GLSRPPNASALIGHFAERSVRRKAVFQVTAHSPRLNCQRDGLADRRRRIAIAALQIDGHRQLGYRDDPPQIVDRQDKRNTLAIGVTVGIGDRPATRGDGLGAARSDRLGAAGVPDVEQNQRLSRNMQRAKFLSLAGLTGYFFLLIDDHAHSLIYIFHKFAAPSAITPGISSGKNRFALSPLRTPRAPGSVRSSHSAHSTPKSVSFSPHTIRAGPFHSRKASRIPVSKFVPIETAY